MEAAERRLFLARHEAKRNAGKAGKNKYVQEVPKGRLSVRLADPAFLSRELNP
jgi:hypothetical protein